ncbi:putative disease resistance RPP13-like protein 2-like [Capsicum annuum]|nr:putative disease resistance RPP13-like protein 2-like [Capsicum annuum]
MLTPPDPGPNYAKFMEEFTLKKAEGFYVTTDEVKEIPVPIDHCYDSDNSKLLLIFEAYDQFQTFKRLFVDLILSFQDRDNSQSYLQKLHSKEAFDVIEAELGFAYDTFYTKAPVIYTPLGCILRVVTFSCTSFSLISFFLCKERPKYHILDLILTYLLLVVTVLLEIYALIISLKSDWTKNWLSKGKQDGMFQQFLRRNPCMQCSDKRRWSNCTPQYNLLSYCVEFKPPPCYRLQNLFLIDEVLEKHKHKKYEDVSLKLKELIFNHFRKFAGESNNEPDPTCLCRSRGSIALDKNDCPSLACSTEVGTLLLISAITWNFTLTMEVLLVP